MQLKYKNILICILIILFTLIYSLFNNPIKEGFNEADSYAQYKRKFDNSTTCSKHKMYEDYTSDSSVNNILKTEQQISDKLGESGYNNLDDLSMPSLELRNSYIRAFGYDELWQPTNFDSDYINNNNYRVKYDVSCPVSVCGKPDNECAEDCRAPKVYNNNSSSSSDYLIEKEGNCMPVEEVINNKTTIKIKVCPFVCQNDNKNVVDLSCQYDDCCEGCGYSIFEVDNNDNYINKLQQNGLNDYSIDTNFTLTSGSVEENAIVTKGTSTTDTGTAPTVIELSNESNIINDYTDTHDCFYEVTGNDKFTYCGPTPYSF
tara:strand:- start:574 stop:1524 length:951 start_codon:yes stop_codon:yes gene_type:complete